MGGSPIPSLACARVTTASRCTGFRARRSSARRLSPPRSHRRFHLNRNLFDKNIRPTRDARWDIAREERKRGQICLSPSSRRINRTACKFGGKVNSSICVSQGRSVLLPHFGSSWVQGGGRSWHGCGSTSSLAPSIRRNRGRAGHFLAAVAVTADGEGGREGETPLTKRKEGRAERAFIILRAIPPSLSSFFSE